MCGTQSRSREEKALGILLRETFDPGKGFISIAKALKFEEKGSSILKNRQPQVSRNGA